ncbi:50S ribosomal protein L23 [Candidatus Falkowbacteria bacterium CG10_big_fil_rev_8_21_14_0_10_39_11]|uniref:Large ribosomal subunit protein uL23 n=1 Tax=Candidatus Falkowbacteria bacterium CG10_big_fil_rev_8_21_14_0_10_39_11 TaxID=1974565 RepID=A0A2H0V5L0_9BACT|nr:MAG: 50S ribosomal protein L23 [Candidatus Falkowbacteria bacterium CG10_big_fil_rev_8_21_14_0_10_39_11]
MSGIINKIFKGKEEDEAKTQTPVKATDTVSVTPKTTTTSPQVETDSSEKNLETPKTTTSDSKVIKKSDPNIYKVLQYPVVTEKASEQALNNKYTFAVPLSANKSEVSKKIINLYGVEPIKVNIVKVNGKKTRNGRTFGQQKSWKKAIVTLAPEDKIEIYEGV